MILNRQRRVRVALSPLVSFLERLRETLRLPDGCVTVCLVSDPEIARLNQTYRGIRASTDVLSFPANGSRNSRRREQHRPRFRRGLSSLTSSRSSTSYLGDIAISPETARRNARRYARPLPAELRILILHGVLHLLGYDHETDTGEMARLERRLRRRLGIV